MSEQHELVPMAVCGLVLLAGCIGFSGPTGTTTTSTPATSPAATSAATPNPTTTERRVTTTDMTPAFGTETVWVRPLEDQSRHAEWPDDETVTFENLSAARQDVFLEALSSDDEVVFSPHEPNPFAFSDQGKPRLVYYNGTWYAVQVAIV